ncbi:MAG: RtcB family protein [Alphaproteobacteria bacterium]|nr:RtcB family protein [Alphaproteobacteria bacterium]
MSTNKRLLKALSRKGLDVRALPDGWSIRLADRPELPAAELLLPPELPLEARAVAQLAGLTGLIHPEGGRVRAAAATPDFHPGDAGVAIGSVVETEGMVVPAAVGTDINCGMRLHVVDLDLERFQAGRDALAEDLRGAFFLGRVDRTQPARAMRAAFREGLLGWHAALEADRDGFGEGLRHADPAQLGDELDRVFGGGSMEGALRWAPADLVPADGPVRDMGLATIGGGNHFVELQVVDAVLDGAAAWAWGVREGQLAFMIHSGSRQVGKGIGRSWRDWAREAWPTGVRHPAHGLFALSVERDASAVRGYLEAEATAANYGFLNRQLIAELVRGALRARFGPLEAPLVYDLPHNITLPVPGAPDTWVTRKGACPAHAGQPVIIPGSMGDASFLALGLGSGRTLCSASHGAGRARSRFEMGRLPVDVLGLEGLRCESLRPDRLVQEAPAAYKPIGPVMDCQARAGVVRPVARLRPLMTFKG